MNIIEQLERSMWEYAFARDAQGFSSLVSPDAVMVCGGYPCSGAEYAQIIKDFTLDSYQITFFETVYSSEQLAQTHYVIMTESQQAPDLAGVFHVTSTWEKRDDGWTLIFNMDSRLN